MRKFRLKFLIVQSKWFKVLKRLTNDLNYGINDNKLQRTTHRSIGTQSYGNIEFWVRTTDATLPTIWSLRDGGTNLLQLSIENNVLR